MRYLSAALLTLAAPAAARDHAARPPAFAIVNDAVGVPVGPPHVTAISWGKTNASGTAIRFLPPEN